MGAWVCGRASPRRSVWMAEASSVRWDGAMFGNQDMVTLTPSATAMIVLACVASVFALGVGFTYLEKHLGLFEKVNPYVIDDVDQYRQMVKRISRQGEELRHKTLMADLPLCALDPESRNAVCAVCQRPCHEANFGSASSAFRGQVTARRETKADGTFDDDFLCVDCFAFIDTQEHAHAKKILEDWHQQGAHASMSPLTKRSQLGSPTAASSRVASPASATGKAASGTENGADDEDSSLPARLSSKRIIRKQQTSPQQAEQNSQNVDQLEATTDGEAAASETRSRHSSSAGMVRMLVQ